MIRGGRVRVATPAGTSTQPRTPYTSPPNDPGTDGTASGPGCAGSSSGGTGTRLNRTAPPRSSRSSRETTPPAYSGRGGFPLVLTPKNRAYRLQVFFALVSLATFGFCAGVEDRARILSAGPYRQRGSSRGVGVAGRRPWTGRPGCDELPGRGTAGTGSRFRGDLNRVRRRRCGSHRRGAGRGPLDPSSGYPGTPRPGGRSVVINTHQPA